MVARSEITNGITSRRHFEKGSFQRNGQIGVLFDYQIVYICKMERTREVNVGKREGIKNRQKLNDKFQNTV